MTYQWIRKLCVCLFALAGLSTSSAWASITCNFGDVSLARLPSVKVAADAPIGAVVWKQTAVPFTAHCEVWALSSSEYAYLYRQALDLSGYGLTFFLTYRGNQGSTAASINTSVYVNRYGISGGVDVPGTVDLELRKTGVTPNQGNVSTSYIVGFRIAGSSSQNDAKNFNIDGLTNISFTSYTCDIDAGSRSIAVSLGDMREDKFTSIGTTSPDKTFNINLNCTQPSGTYNATLTFSATADSSQVPGVIALTSDPSAAAGVGIQLLMNGQPVSLNTALSAGAATTGTTISVPMTARYYQTAAKVKPGKANGIATFVVSYK